MKRKSKWAAAALFSLTLLLSGCSDAAFGTDSMLRPPRATGDKADIQDIITKEAGGTYTLKYPQKGDYRSAIIMRNENTSTEYALALYSTEKDTKLNASVIMYHDNIWECAGTFTNTGAGIDRVLFKDINGDKTEEIIIGWTAYNSAKKTLTAYSMTTEGVFEMKVDETYDELVVADVVNNKTDDLLLLSLSTQETPSTATLLQYSEEKKRPIGKYSLERDPTVTSFSNILVGKVAINTKESDEVKDTATGAPSQTGKQQNSQQENSKQENSKQENSKQENSKQENSKQENSKQENSKQENSKQENSKQENSKQENSKQENSKQENSKPDSQVPAKTVELNPNGVVLECNRSDNTICTQLVYYDLALDELVDPLVTKNNNDTYTNLTVRTDAVYSWDVNNDGVIDIPVVSQMMAGVEEMGANVCSLTGWQNYDARGRKMKTVMNTVINLKDGYYFILPERWSNNVTARSDVETRELTFYAWNSKTSSAGDKLLTLCRFTEQQWEEADKKGLVRLEAEDAGGKAVFAARIFETSSSDTLNIKTNEVKKSFYLI